MPARRGSSPPGAPRRAGRGPGRRAGSVRGPGRRPRRATGWARGSRAAPPDTIGTMSNKEAVGRRWTRLGPEARREQILETAQGLFEERGYDGVSMSDVATAAQVTRGLVHHYFGS